MAGQTDTRSRVLLLALIGTGGFLGAVSRYAVALALPAGFPWGTLVANVLGSFALGLLLYERRFADALATETRVAVGTGFLASFTTYSTFAVETLGLSLPLAAVNVAGTYGLGFLGVVCGRWVGRWVS